MGYHTAYNLIVRDANGVKLEPHVLKVLIEELVEQYELIGIFEEDGSCSEGCKWYEHHKHMCAFSTKYPLYLFELNGWGEELGDIWTTWYFGGKMHKKFAKIEYGKFDPEKLHELNMAI